MTAFFQNQAFAVTSTFQRTAVYVVAALAVAAALFYAFRADPIPVDFAAVDRGALHVTVDEEGITQVREVYVVSAPVSGRVRRLELKVGDPVKEGQTLVATIEPAAPSFLDERSRRSARALFHAAQAAHVLTKAKVASAKAEYEFAQAEYKRAETLVRRGTVSEKTFDKAKLDLAMRKASLDTAQAELLVREQEVESARANMIEPISGNGRDARTCCIQVMAPASGQVLKVHSESARVIAQGAAILEIGDARDLEIIVEVLSSDAVQLKPGAKATIEQWGSAVPLNARVRTVEPTAFTKVSALGIEEQRVKVHLDIDDPRERWRLLGHDYRVFARIRIWSGEDVVRVPMSALFRKGNDWSLYVLKDDAARLVPVRLGARNSLMAEVVDGLAPGDQVILHPSDRVADGVRVVSRASLD